MGYRMKFRTGSGGALQGGIRALSFWQVNSCRAAGAADSEIFVDIITCDTESQLAPFDPQARAGP